MLGAVRILLWDGRIPTEKEVYAPIAGQLTAFKQHRRDLLARLRNAYDRGPKSGPFDEVGAWRHLTYLAQQYFWRPIRKPLLPSLRATRLDDLAKALRKARHLVEKAMPDDVGDDLYHGWCEANITPGSPQGLKDRTLLFRIVDEIRAAATGLANLEAAAQRAAQTLRTVPKKKGAQRGRGILPPDYILGLGACYRRNTGLEPDIDAKPFADFVEEFLKAVGRTDDTSNDYVFEAIKYAHRKRRKNATK